MKNWKIGKSPSVVISDEKGNLEDEVFFGGKVVCECVNKDDMNLIVSAPMLLDACMRVKMTLDDLPIKPLTTLQIIQTCLNIVNTAIEKASGR